MVAFSTLSGLSALSLLFSLVQKVHGVSLEVSTEGGNSSSPLLYGFMFEVGSYYSTLKSRKMVLTVRRIGY